MVASTKMTGAHGTVNIGGSDVTVESFSIDIKRGIATQGRVGTYSDRKIAGKVDVTGSLVFDDINGAMIARLLHTTLTSPVTTLGAATTFTLYGDAVDASTNRVKIQLANCFFTSATMKFGDANSFISGPMEFTMQDPHNDMTLTYS